MVEFGSRIVFPTDPTDVWGNIHTIGNAELAARLSSINTFDRRGDVVWMDDFESNVPKWAETTVGAGNSKEYSTDRAFMGSTSMKLITGAADGRVMGIQKKFALPRTTKIGIEARVFMETEDTWTTVIIYGRADNYLYYGRVRWSFTDRTFQYQPKTGPWITLKDNTFNDTGDEAWIPIKLVIDYDTLKYVRVIFGDTEYDLSSEALPTMPIPGVDSILIGVDVTAKAAASSIIYVDNVIFTQNEP